MMVSNDAHVSFIYETLKCLKAEDVYQLELA